MHYENLCFEYILLILLSSNATHFLSKRPETVQASCIHNLQSVLENRQHLHLKAYTLRILQVATRHGVFQYRSNHLLGSSDFSSPSQGSFGFANRDGASANTPQFSGTRGGNRTLTPLTELGILSPLRLPVPPPGHADASHAPTRPGASIWRVAFPGPFC